MLDILSRILNDGRCAGKKLKMFLEYVTTKNYLKEREMFGKVGGMAADTRHVAMWL